MPPPGPGAARPQRCLPSSRADTPARREVFCPCEIYYHAPADVRDGLIHALLSAEYSSAASNLMSCLAMQGDDKAMETLLELERNPRPWRKGLYVDPLSREEGMQH